MSRHGLDGWGWVLLILGLGHLANGVWMLASPGSWYEDLPAGVPDYGPLNVHFVRDIGCAFAAVGVALVWSALRTAHRLPLVAMATLFVGAHAVLHVHDTARGLVDAHHWLLDLPTVYLPTALLAAAWVHCARDRQAAT
jgi:hypothetical protein